jgi:GntR family transcriptional regulator
MAFSSKRSFVPVYYQIAEDLSADIEEGRLRPGDVIPSEAQLCERYGISRMTVRQGLNMLSEAGYIHSVPGKGSFVSSPRLDRISIEFQEGVLDDGRRLEPRLLGVDVVHADDEVAERLGLAPLSKVVEFRRISSLDGVPVTYELKYLPYRKGAPLVEREIEYAAFPTLVAQMCELHFVKVRMTFSCAIVCDDAHTMLGLSDSSAYALVMEQCVLTRDGRTLGWGKTYCAPEQYRLAAESDPFWQRM